jgi:DNA-binding transcriptional MerR regulator
MTGEPDVEPVTATTTVSTEALARAAGVTYRRVDYWVRCGYISPVGEPSPGTGALREFAPAQVERAMLLARLVGAGLTHRAAVRVIDDRRPDPLAGGWVARLDVGLAVVSAT